MKRRKKNSRKDPVAGEPTSTQVYSLKVLVELTGLSEPAILRYAELGLVTPVMKRIKRYRFDEEALRTLRRIEHLRSYYGMNLPSLGLTLRLLQERDELELSLKRFR